ncbi:MAG: ECF-type sigma factor [Phycisphaerae bacterium]|nr:ECF-type sigma factor [Phycisphaerae bacterium]
MPTPPSSEPPPDRHSPVHDPLEATLLIQQAAQGDHAAAERLLPIVYSQLRTLAGSCMRGDLDQTLQPTALVHEAYLRLFAMPEPARDREHFLAIASMAMRQILADHARRRKAIKRGSGRARTTVEDADLGGLLRPVARNDDDDALVALHDALERLAHADERRYRVVELRFLGGMTVEETARIMELSERTVENDWRAARAWLKQALAG